MRILLLVVLAACSGSPKIGPDDSGSLDAAPTDGSAPDVVTPKDSSSPDGSNPGDINTSGSRLKIVVITGSDGSKQVQPHMLDTQTGCFCDWGPTSVSSWFTTPWTCQPYPGSCPDAGSPSSWAQGTPSSL